MLETFLLASDADEMKKKKEKPSVKNVEMRKSAVAIWGKDKATGQFSQWWKKVLRPLSTVTGKGTQWLNSVVLVPLKRKKKKRWQVKNEDWWLTVFQECLCLCSEVSVENGLRSNGTVFKSLSIIHCLHTPQNSPITNYLDTILNINTKTEEVWRWSYPNTCLLTWSTNYYFTILFSYV